MAIRDAARGRFAVIGEPIVAVDLINTVAVPGSPVTEDLLAKDGDARAAEFLSDPSRAGRLRRCGNPACSMIFIAVNPRRSWCTPDVCGNRVRVARHYRRAGRP